MNWYTAYKATGEIVSTFTSDEQSLEVNTPAGTSLLVGVALDPAKYYVSQGVGVPLGTPPTRWHVFNFATKTWEDSRTTEQAWAEVRRQRNVLLDASDWRVVRALEIGPPMSDAWVAYRQALRDITVTNPDPRNITWPTAPAEDS